MKKLLSIGFAICIFISSQFLIAQSQPTAEKTIDLDQRISKIIKDWNVPGCAVGIVKNNQLIYAKGFGYRDVENKLPVTPNTMFAIGSNTKLFTAIAMGMLVEEGKLEWDKPIKNMVPSIHFFNDQLNNRVTLRDMLAHRTGLNSPDGIWFYSNFSRKELFQKLKYCEPLYSLREKYMYNNFMYIAAGEIIDIVAGKTWEKFLQERIFNRLEMTLSNFTIEDMEKTPDYAKPYMNDYFNNKIIEIKYNREMQGITPAGGINSNIIEMANWVICQLDNGKFKGNQVIPTDVINATMVPNVIANWYLQKELKELNYSHYGMGRVMTTYKGHKMTEHGGLINGFLSKVTIFPDDKLGIIILTNTQTQPVRNFLQFEIADRMLGLEKTKWHERMVAWRKGNIERAKKTLSKNKPIKILKTKPSHDLAAYTGVFKNEIYGKIIVKLIKKQLWFQFYNFNFPLNHTHYDQFETPAHKQYGQYNITFLTNKPGNIDRICMDLDWPEVIFKKIKK